jgi:hypothetical protein
MYPEGFPILQYTIQLYYHTLKMNIGDDSPIQIASGILIKGPSRFYVLTCKHVFDNIKPDDVIILTSGGFAIRLPNEVKFIDNGNDSIDLALIQLKNERLKELKSRYSFLPYGNLGFNHIFDEELYYMLFGFVNKKTNQKNHVFHVGSFGYLTGIRRYRKIEKMGFNYDNNVTLEYSRKQGDFNDDNVRQLGYRDLKGLSGGGIWLSVAGKKPDTFKYILVGIMIEERIERGFIIGTKVSLIEKEVK